MNIRFGIRENQTHFRPGDEISGAVLWEGTEKPKVAEVRLLWFTRGKGTEDSEVVESVNLGNPSANDRRPFRLKAPTAPHSFSGRLISLIWVVECELQPGDYFERAEIVVAPEAKEIVLPNASATPANLPNPVSASRPLVS